MPLNKPYIGNGIFHSVVYVVQSRSNCRQGRYTRSESPGGRDSKKHCCLDVPRSVFKRLSYLYAHLHTYSRIRHSNYIASGVIFVSYRDSTQNIAPLQSVFLGVLSNPGAQCKAQEELDRVLGPGNLPDFSHVDDLPYVTALVKEVLRWHDPAPICECFFK